MKAMNIAACVLLVVVISLSVGRSQDPSFGRFGRSFVTLVKPGDGVDLTPGTFPYRLTVYSAEEVEELESDGSARVTLYDVINVGDDYICLSRRVPTAGEPTTRKELCVPAWSIASLSRTGSSRN